MVRLKKLADSRDGDLKDVLGMEREISRVQGEIEQFTGQLKRLTNLTSLTTVTLSAEEIKDYVPAQDPTFATQISRSFSGSISTAVFAGQSLVIFAVAVVPWLLMLIALLLGLRFLWRSKMHSE